jgi:hypothetical protein
LRRHFTEPERALHIDPAGRAKICGSVAQSHHLLNQRRQRINDIYVPKIETAKSPEEQQQIEPAASQEMVCGRERRDQRRQI